MPDDELDANAADVELFQSVEGSQTSNDGQGFAIHARRRDGSDVMLVFPHSEISNIVENTAMQLSHGRDETGNPWISAFKTSSFQIGLGADQQTVLSLMVGETGKINFLLPSDLEKQLFEVLRQLQTRH